MTDLFEEVEGQLRSERYRSLGRRILPWALAAAAAVVIGVLAYWGYDTYRARTTAQASESYQAAVEAFNAGDEAKAVQLWSEVSKSQARGYKTLALMHLGGLQLGDEKTAEAVKLFDEAAAAAPNEILGDVARLKSAFALLDTAPFKDVEARLTPLTEDGRPYRAQAREALAFAKLMAGDAAGARGDFVALSRTLDASQGAQARAQAAIGLIDSGSAKAVPGVVKSAAATPPGPPVLPGLSLPAQPQPQANGPQ